jgi:signal peptidase I
METLAVLSLIPTVAFVTSMLMCWLAMRFLGVDRPTLGRAALVTVGGLFVVLSWYVFLIWIRYVSLEYVFLDFGVYFVWMLILSPVFAWIIAHLARTRWRCGFVILFFQLLGCAFGLGLSGFLLNISLVKTMEVKRGRGAMAPTLVGEHWRTTCPHCGEVAIQPVDGRLMEREIEGRRVRLHAITCSSCGKYATTEVAPFDPERIFLDEPGKRIQKEADQIVINALYKPRRWDIIAFRLQDDPNNFTELSRLAGMPGETVFVDDGDLWVNGERQPLPESVGKWKYTMLDPERGAMRASREWPMTLGPNHYFVLGDFAWDGDDSRLWGAVETTNVVGVVSLRSWPPSRWAILR